jgi:hypothetical protein
MKKIVLFVCLLSSVARLNAQIKIESPSDLKNYLPHDLYGYVEDGNGYSAELKNEDGNYFVAAKKYSKAKQMLTIVAFDYRAASPQLSKVTSAFQLDKLVDDTDTYSLTSILLGCKTQELLNKKDNSAQIFLYCGNRFLITVSSASENLVFLKTIVEQINPTKLPN